jgi:hypothetical protein
MVSTVAGLSPRELGVLAVLCEHFRSLHQGGDGLALSRDGIATRLDIEPDHVARAVHRLVEPGWWAM